MLRPGGRPPRHPALLLAGVLVFGLGVVGGLLFVAIVGTDSPEFRKYFIVFVGMYMVGITLAALGK